MPSVHVKHVTLLTAALLAAGTLTADTKPEQQPQFLFESKIVSSENILFHAAATDATGVIGDNQALRALLVEWQANDDISVLSMPSITALANQEAVIRVQFELQYFERTEDGKFVLIALPEDESSGVRLAATTHKTTDKGQVSVDVDLQVNTLRDRKKLPGVSLDVGRPLMQTRNIKTQNVMPLGQWVWLGNQQLQDVASGKRENLVILLRVTRNDAE